MANLGEKRSGILFGGAIVLAAVGLVSCAGASFRSTWKDPQYHGGPAKRIVVFVVARDQAVRPFAEEEIVRNLPTGTQATAGYRIIANLDEDKGRIRDRLVADGYDGALVARLVGIVEDRTYQPPQTMIVPTGRYYDPASPYGVFPGYMGYAWQEVAVAGRTRQDTRIVVEMLLYKLPEGKPIWTGVTDSMNPQSREELVDQITELVGKRLRSEGLIGES
jgi:hypothetical protein